MIENLMAWPCSKQMDCRGVAQGKTNVQSNVSFQRARSHQRLDFQVKIIMRTSRIEYIQEIQFLYELYGLCTSRTDHIEDNMENGLQGRPASPSGTQNWDNSCNNKLKYSSISSIWIGFESGLLLYGLDFYVFGIGANWWLVQLRNGCPGIGFPLV